MAQSATANQFAKTLSDKTASRERQNGANHHCLVRRIKGLYEKNTVKILASWLKVSVDTAKHRLRGEREFNLDEVVTLLHSEHGFEILSALMSRAERPPRWWRECMPLMDLADAEHMVVAARRRARNVIKRREGVIDALEAEIRRAQTVVIHGSE